MMCASFKLAVLWFFILSVLIGSSTGNRNLTRSQFVRQRRQASCNGFKCRNGECIDEDFKCDGKVDCRDGSDETEACKDLMCRGNIFRCKYGACISKRLECDGKNDCRDGSDENTPNCGKSKNPKCKRDEFQCKDKRCINIDNKCDGTPDCADLSDETEEACLKLLCPGHTFKCKYGACVSRKAPCNGIEECFDGSDESPETCDRSGAPTRPVTSKPPVTASPPPNKRRPPNEFIRGSCTLPPKVQNGAWSVWPYAEYDYEPGDLVAPGATIQINCKKGHVVLETQMDVTLSVCENSVWSIRNHQCTQICKPIEETPNTIVSCTNGGIDVSCKAPTEGTIARFKCPNYYELSSFGKIRSCSDGTWDDDPPHCIPVCGEETVTIKELIIGGKKVKKGYYPWTIALYKRYNETAFDHICGGSLISDRVVVTAAHCVTDTQGRTNEKELYRLGAGKYFRIYDHPNDTDAEYSEVEEIYVYNRYKSSTLHYEGDIAIVIARKPFKPTLYIQRICVDWDPFSVYEGRLLNSRGVVTGWGYTKSGSEPSDILKELELPYVDFNRCYEATPDKYKPYIREDKMCAGFLNEGIGVCEGDSGGGLAFMSKENNNRFFLRGIVSVAPHDNGTCNEYVYAFYTKVSKYLSFMKPIVQQYEKRQNT